jgi:phosphoribosylaminoimidazole-succinocarboxamide synthase
MSRASLLRVDGELPSPRFDVSVPEVPLFSRGKVRDMLDLGDALLMVASDRISAFDVVMREPIPGKGIVLTACSELWFAKTGHIVPNHLISARFDDFPSQLDPHRDLLDGRSLLVKRAERVDIECVARGYLAGSGWAEYREHGTLAGERLPAGLRESEQLPEPRFTPAIKAASGHDENISVAHMARLVGSDLTSKLEALTLALYAFAHGYAAERGILLADTKFEFGFVGEELTLIDEALTPDSSRFWPLDGYESGRPQPSYDKQFVRDFLQTTGWNKEPPPPSLPAEVVNGTADRYREAYLRLASKPGSV